MVETRVYGGLPVIWRFLLEGTGTRGYKVVPQFVNAKLVNITCRTRVYCGCTSKYSIWFVTQVVSGGAPPRSTQLALSVMTPEASAPGHLLTSTHASAANTSAASSSACSWGRLGRMSPETMGFDHKKWS